MTTSHATEPYTHGLMDVGDGHQVYWECHGNPDGPAGSLLPWRTGQWLYPPDSSDMFDLRTYRVLLFDQRGCGRSRPLANAATADLSANTTHHLIADVELLRQHLGIEQWTLLGLSWGTTLGLAYAQLHPQRVAAAVFGLGNDHLSPRSGLDHRRRRPHLPPRVGALRRRRTATPAQSPIGRRLRRTALRPRSGRTGTCSRGVVRLGRHPRLACSRPPARSPLPGSSVPPALCPARHPLLAPRCLSRSRTSSCAMHTS